MSRFLSEVRPSRDIATPWSIWTPATTEVRAPLWLHTAVCRARAHSPNVITPATTAQYQHQHH